MAFIGIGSIEGPVPYFDRGIMNILDMTGISVESLKSAASSVTSVFTYSTPLATRRKNASVPG